MTSTNKLDFSVWAEVWIGRTKSTVFGLFSLGLLLHWVLGGKFHWLALYCSLGFMAAAWGSWPREGVATSKFLPWVTLFLVLVAGGIHFEDLAQRPIWSDEDLQVGPLLFGASGVEAATNVMQPPLFHEISGLSMRLLGPSSFSARLVSWFAGTVSVGITWLIALSLGAPWWFALSAATAVLGNNLLISYSQEAKPIALGFLFSLFFLHSLLSRKSVKWFSAASSTFALQAAIGFQGPILAVLLGALRRNKGVLIGLLLSAPFFLQIVGGPQTRTFVELLSPAGLLARWNMMIEALSRQIPELYSGSEYIFLYILGLEMARWLGRLKIPSLLPVVITPLCLLVGHFLFVNNVFALRYGIVVIPVAVLWLVYALVHSRSMKVTVLQGIASVCLIFWGVTSWTLKRDKIYEYRGRETIQYANSLQSKVKNPVLVFQFTFNPPKSSESTGLPTTRLLDSNVFPSSFKYFDLWETKEYQSEIIGRLARENPDARRALILMPRSISKISHEFWSTKTIPGVKVENVVVLDSHMPRDATDLIDVTWTGSPTDGLSRLFHSMDTLMADEHLKLNLRLVLVALALNSGDCGTVSREWQRLLEFLKFTGQDGHLSMRIFNTEREKLCKTGAFASH